MKKSFAFLLSPFLAVCAMSAHAASPARQHLLLDADWRFKQLAPTALRNTTSISTWRWRVSTGNGAAQITNSGLDTTGGDWQDTATGKQTLSSGTHFGLYQTTLPDLTAPSRILHFEGVDDNATVYLNGHNLLRHEGWNDPFDVPLDQYWNAAGLNIVTVLAENTNAGGGITAPVTLGVQAAPEAGVAPFSPDLNDGAWRTVHLPHDYVLESAFTPKGDASHGSLIPTPAWYRKTFTLPASDKGRSLWLDFDGVYRDSKIYLNGQEIGQHACGYTPFHLDISQAARYGGKNVLAVQVNPQHEEGWWYEGGGIYRHVWLNVADAVHIAPWGTFVSAKLPEPGADGQAAPAAISVKTAIGETRSDLNAAHLTAALGVNSYRLTARIFDPAGKVVASTETPFGEEANPQIAQQLTVDKPQLWSIETPQLYRLHTEIKQGSRVVDATDTPFGIRTIRFDAEKGFFLNGKPVKIKGTCNHQDFAGVGVAMPDSLLYWRVKKLKEMGSNAYRMSHNPPTAELLDACDKLGMLVMDENRHLGDTENGKASLNTPYADLHEVQSMVLRDRNHPSVIMWSMCNEEGIQYSKEGAQIFAAMKKAVDNVDGTRPVTCAMNGGYDSPVGITSVEDLQGINYNSGGYDGFHKAHPTMPLYGSETSSEVGTRGIYTREKFENYQGEPAKGYVAAYDFNAVPWGQTAEEGWKTIADRPFVAGGYVWTGFDYKGEPTPFGWPDINSNFGIMDQCGFPKDNYYYYQSVWGDKPIVHLLPHWNWAGKQGQPIDVWAFSNADRVELFLNGTSLGVKDMPKNEHLSWSVPYAPGTLEAKGYGSDGKTIATDKVETTSTPAALRLHTDRTKLIADGEDLTMVEVDVVDAQGRIVPNADNLVFFAVSGAGHIAGVGNGNPSSHEPDKAAYRHSFNGKCLVIVGTDEHTGDIHLSATASGLKGATLDFQSKK